ncbi:MAG: phosphoribosylformylglycinamidine synthase, purS protein [Candidatus Marinimicrobia bacterium]|nr:phosphoribosylformylglycinamidine synthase, purS protein [Candidatus Neomarinimicrobiota bacterium]|tara:strand:+ start:867 stop:1112 length:246 start_codon:yes stop_codon:yes gene_type:complete
MKAKIFIKYKDGILDPQGKVTGNALNSIGVKGIESLSIGKYIEMEFDDITRDEADKIANDSCKKLLVNPNTQTYSYEIIND